MNTKILIFLAVIYLLLAIVTFGVYYYSRQGRFNIPDELKHRTRSWLLLLVILTLALFIHRAIITLFFALVSFIAVKEFFTRISSDLSDRRLLVWSYIIIGLQFLFAYYQWYGAFISLIPVYLFLFMPLRFLLAQQDETVLKSSNIIQWGFMMSVFTISHAAYLINLPTIYMGLMTGVSLLIFLVFLTELNEMAHGFWEKRYGKKPLFRGATLDKTWEGFLAGLATTTIAALIIGPFLTVFSWEINLILGIIIGLTGFVGDLIIRAIKKLIDLKPMAKPHNVYGSILDRINSLIFTAPVFVLLVTSLYY